MSVYIHSDNMKWNEYAVFVDHKQIEDWICADDARGIVVARLWHVTNGEVDGDNLDVYRGKVEVRKI